MQINTYLTFDGNAREAITFYADLFGVDVQQLMTFGEMPDGGAPDPALNDRIAHARIDFNGRSLMVSDTGPWSPHQGFAGFSVQVDCETTATAHAVFEKLSNGGTITMPMGPTFWAPAFGMCADRFGVPWMVNCDTETA